MASCGRWQFVVLVSLLFLITGGSPRGFAQTEVGLKVSQPSVWIWSEQLFGAITVFPGVMWELGLSPTLLRNQELVASSNVVVKLPVGELFHVPWRLTGALGGTVRYGAQDRFFKSSTWYVGPQFRGGIDLVSKRAGVSLAVGTRWVHNLTRERLSFFEMGMYLHW